MRSLSGARVVVTGGCGFIGTAVVRGFLDRGVSRIVVIDDMSTSPPLARERLTADPRVEVSIGSLEKMRVHEWLAHLHGSDFVVHLAARKHRSEIDSPDQLVRSNVIGTSRLIDAVSQVTSIRRMVFSSSLYVYGRMNQEHFSETDPPEVRTLYGASKLLGEELFLNSKIPGDVLRFFFVYGPRSVDVQTYPSVIHENFKRLAKGECPRIVGDGMQRLDYVYVDDVVSAIECALLRECPGDVFNIASGQTTSIMDLTTRMLTVARSRLNPIFLPSDHTHGSCRGASIEKSATVLGWRPSIGLDEGLLRTWRSIASDM